MKQNCHSHNTSLNQIDKSDLQSAFGGHRFGGKQDMCVDGIFGHLPFFTKPSTEMLGFSEHLCTVQHLGCGDLGGRICIWHPAVNL
mmetsp:Transcript_38397/g.63814  ORF Transcript_38397/g.63814 Transcript_38397/m.63814 type:complete len:86 (+) Transcript_38397:130-387(+)